MAYNNTPLAAQRKNDSQPLIQANFQALQTFLNLNHENIATGNGKHTYVTLPIHAAPATAATELGIYSKTINTHTEPYFVRDNIIGTELPLSTIFNHTLGTINYAILPGGLKIRWGSGKTDTTSGSGQTYAKIDINNTIPADAQFTQLPTVVVSRRSAAGDTNDHTNRAVYVSNLTLAAPICNLYVTSFQTNNSNPAAAIGYSFNYIAIGI